MYRTAIMRSISLNRFRYFATKNQSFNDDEQAAMTDAKQVLKSFGESIVELKDYNDWVPTVMKSKVPVILDWYADWWGPCRKLAPILEKKAIEADGKFKLVKVNIDNLPEIANGLQVRSIPAVFLVSNGSVMDTFVGLPNQDRIDDFVNTAILLDKLSHDEKTIDQVIIAAEDHVRSRDYKTAIEVFQQTYKTAKFTDEQNSTILLNLALCHAKLGEEITAKEYFIKWEAKHKNDKLDVNKQNLLDEYHKGIQEIRAQEGEDEVLTKLEEKLKATPQDCQIMYDIAQRHLEKERYEEVIDFWLDILAIDRNWNNSAPHKLLLEVFNKLGANNEIVKQGRKKLMRILF